MMSQLVPSNLEMPVGSNCEEHSAGLAVTVTGAVASALASAGLAASVSMWNTGNIVRAANVQPVMMIFLRPILSDRLPITRKNGVPSNSARMVSSFAVSSSTCSILVRKKKE